VFPANSPMSAAPYLIALALLEQDGRRAMPLQGTSLRQPLAPGVDPGEEGQRQALELLVRVWQRSEDGPLRRAAGPSSLLLATLPIEALMDQMPQLKARWIERGDTEELLRELEQLGASLWSVSLEKNQPLLFSPLVSVPA
jgi:hypothetical protein